MDIRPQHCELTIAVSALEGAAAGLWYPSETDALVSLAIVADPLPTPEAVAEKLAGGAPYAICPAEDFFRPIVTNPYWASDQGGHLAQKYASLRDVLESHVDDLHSYRVGEVEVTLYILGQHSSGCYLGVCTRVVET